MVSRMSETAEPTKTQDKDAKDAKDAKATHIARSVVEAIDFEEPARSALGGWVRIGAIALSTYAFVSVLRTTSAPLLVPNTKAALNGDEYEGHRYGMTLAERQAIFADLAAVEIAERQRAIAANTWSGHLWSREDDRGWKEMSAARRIAAERKRSLTQVYMVLDEAIRERWPGPDGQPLPATTPPLDPRTTW
jgi:hypothetical protein